MKNRSIKNIFILTVAIVMLSTFIAPVSANEGNTSSPTDFLSSYGLTPVAYAGETTVVNRAEIDGNGRLSVTAGGNAGQNLFISAPLGNLAGNLEEYSIEAKLMGVGMSDGWHYGIGWNNSQKNSNENWYSMRTGAYNASKNNGELRCWVQKVNGVAQGSNANQMGKPDTPFSSMSAANGTENVFKATVKKVEDATKITFYMNGVEVISITDSVSSYTLLDFNVIIPYSTTVAISYMRVYDGSGVIVYNEQFGNTSATKHTVTVNYEYEDHSTAAPSATKEISEGAFYSIESPAIEGYVPTDAIVSGIMGNRDTTVTVTYRTMKTLTIHYVDSNGNQMFEDVVVDKLATGDAYCVETIPVANYAVDTEKVEGTVGTSNLDVTVTYTPKKYTLTVKYVYEDGSQAEKDYVGLFEYKTAYRVLSPVIEGYSADQTVVTSDLMGKDTAVTVTYYANKRPVSTEESTQGVTAESQQVTDHTKSNDDQDGCISVVAIGNILPLLIVASIFITKKERTK